MPCEVTMLTETRLKNSERHNAPEKTQKQRSPRGHGRCTRHDDGMELVGRTHSIANLHSAEANEVGDETMTNLLNRRCPICRWPITTHF